VKITINCKSVIERLTLLQSTTKSSSCSLSIVKRKGMPFLRIAAQDNSVLLEFYLEDVEVLDDSGDFSISIDVLRGIIIKRSKLLIEYNSEKTSIRFKSEDGKYSGTAVTLPYDKVDFGKISGTVISLSKDIYASFMSTLRRIKISDIYNTTDGTLSVLADIRPKGIRLATYDQYHLATSRLTKNIDIEHPLDFILPFDVFDTLDSLSGKTSYKMSITESSILAMNETFRVSIPRIQSSFPVSMEQVSSLVKTIPKNPDIRFVLDTEHLSDALANASALVEANSPINVSNTRKGLQVSIKTSYGSLSEVLDTHEIDWNSDSSFNLDPHVLNDIVSTMDGEKITVIITQKHVVLVDKDSHTFSQYFCSLI